VSSRAALDVSHLPAQRVDTRALLWWGQALMLVIEATVFALLVAVYLYLRFRLPDWPPPGVKPPALRWPTVNLLVLVASAVPIRRADKAAERGDRRGVQIGLLTGIVLGLVFLVGQVLLWRSFEFNYASHAYGSIVYAILGAHTTHVVAATAESVVLAWLAFRPGRFHEEQRLGVVTGGLYWDFVVGSWLLLYLVVYIGPRVL
jgi:heme/copper-type cytochrome/quinol oxidase subunit 3